MGGVYLGRLSNCKQITNRQDWEETLTVKGRRVLKHTCEVYNTQATYSQWFLHSHHASKGPCDSRFFPYFSITLSETTTSGSKTECRFLQNKNKKWRERELNKLGFHFKRNKKKVLYILRATLKKFTIGFRHFLGHHISEMLGKALAFPSPGSATAFTTKLPSLQTTNPIFFFKTWCKQNPLESEQGWPRVHCTKADPQRDRESQLASDSGNSPGSNMQS